MPEPEAPGASRVGPAGGRQQRAGRRFADRLCAFLARVLANIFFHRWEVVGQEHLPQAGPALVVGNHVNSLIDPLLIAAGMPFFPRMLGKSTLWDMAALRPVLALAGVVPVYRRQDQGVDTSKNAEMFARCREVLAAGGAIALFPEGISHNEPELAPLRTGAARIALDAQTDPGARELPIVPVGLTFDDKGRFRSRALLQVGKPIRAADFGDLYEAQPLEAAKALTARIEGALREVTLNYRSWDEAALIARAVELFDRPSLELPSGRRLRESFALRQAFLVGSREMSERYPSQVREAARAVRAYDELLSSVGLSDDQVAAKYPVPGVLRYLAVTFLVQAIDLPLAAIGFLLNWVPYQLAGLFGRRARLFPDQLATWKLFPSLVLYPMCWGLAAAVAAWVGGHWGWAAAALALAPLTGWFAMRYRYRRSVWWRETRAFLFLRTKRRLAHALRRRRQQAQDAVTHLAGLYLMTDPPQGLADAETIIR